MYSILYNLLNIDLKYDLFLFLELLSFLSFL